jgi:hypothetical protein
VTKILQKRNTLICRHTYFHMVGLYSRDSLFSVWGMNWDLRNNWLSKYLAFYEESTKSKICCLLWESYGKQLSVDERSTRYRLSQSGLRIILRSRHIILHKNQNKVVTAFRLYSKDSLITIIIIIIIIIIILFITKRMIRTIPVWRLRKYCVLQTLS